MLPGVLKNSFSETFFRISLKTHVIESFFTLLLKLLPYRYFPRNVPKLFGRSIFQNTYADLPLKRKMYLRAQRRIHNRVKASLRQQVRADRVLNTLLEHYSFVLLQQFLTKCCCDYKNESAQLPLCFYTKSQIQIY